MSEVMQNSVVAVSSDKPTAADVKKTRNTGIPVIGNVSWGTHFCQFYQTKEDLVDVLVPYFKAGLESNEFCMWVTSEPLNEKEAEEAMRKAVPDFDLYLKRGQIEIALHDEWYLKEGVFNLQRVLNAWINKLEQALANGYDGIRVTGNTAWLEKKDWKDFADYEEEVNSVIGKYRMMAICTYLLDKCSASEVIDVVRNHQFTLIRRIGEWELIESSEIKRTKEALKGSEILLNDILAASPEAITTTDLNGNIVNCNQATLDIHGFSSKEELIGKNALEFIAEKDRQRAVENLKKTIEQEVVRDIEYNFLTKDGREFPGELSASVIKGSSGNPTGFVGMTKDITERKKAEESLRKSEDRWRSLIENAPNVILIVDRDGKIQFINRTVIDASQEEMIGKSIYNYIDHKHHNEVRKTIEQVFQTGEGGGYEASGAGSNGSTSWYKTNVGPIRHDGQIISVTLITTDITEIKKTEGALLASEEKFKGIFENVNDVITYVDKHGKILDANKRVEEVLGYKRDEIIGKNFTKLGFIDLKSLPKTLKLFVSTIRSGEVEKLIELKLKHKNGNDIFMEVGTRFIKKNGKVKSVVNIFRDITARKRMENELKRYSEHLAELVKERARQLEEAQEHLLRSERLATIGELATMVGHDLRNPLQSIENAAYYLNNELQLLAPSLPNPQKTMEMLQAINNSVNYAAKILRELQDFSATRTPILKKTNINNIVRDTLQQTQTSNNVELQTEMGNLPEIEVDEDQIKRVFMNLAVNGIQAMENGGGTLTVSTKQTKGFVEISFKDTGTGISMENLQKLFNPLFTTKARGMGMGLSICKKFVQGHGGSIEVETEEGKGSTFRVKLPLTQENGGENP
jgi:PAS domain S-box-containing protein